MTIPRDDPLGQRERPPGLPTRGTREVKLAENIPVPSHALGSHTGDPGDIGAASTDHSHLPLNNYGASVAPAVTDDFTLGYGPGSEWVDVASDKAYVCLDATEGAAVWTETTQTPAGGGDPDAIHDNVAGEIVAITEKVTPVAADLLVIEDSAAANAKKRVQVGNLPGGGVTEHGALTGLGDDDHPQYGALAQAETWAALQTFSAGLKLAAAQQIQDSGGTGRILLATASPHLTLTGDAQVTGHLGISVAPTADRYLNISPVGATLSSTTYFLSINPASSSITASTLAVYGVYGAPAFNLSAALTDVNIYGLSYVAFAAGGLGSVVSTLVGMAAGVGVQGFTGAVTDVKAMEASTSFSVPTSGSYGVTTAQGLGISIGGPAAQEAYGTRLTALLGRSRYASHIVDIGGSPIAVGYHADLFDASALGYQWPFHYGDIVLNAATTTDDTAAGSTTVAFVGASGSFAQTVTASNPDTVLTVEIAYNSPLASRVTGVTYGGVAMTRLQQANTTGISVDVWYLVNPPTGSNTVAITLTASFTVAASARVFYNVDQVTPVGLGTKNTGSNGTPTATQPDSRTNEIIVGAVAINVNKTMTAGVDETELFDVASGTVVQLAGYKQAGSINGVISPTIDAGAGTERWAMVTFSVRYAVRPQIPRWGVDRFGATSEFGQEGSWSATGANATLASDGLYVGMPNPYGTDTGGGLGTGGIYLQRRGAAAGNEAGLRSVSTSIHARQLHSTTKAKCQVPSWTSVRFFFGLAASITEATVLGADNPAVDHIGIQVPTGRANANFWFVTRLGANQTAVDSGIAPTAQDYFFVLSFNADATDDECTLEILNASHVPLSRYTFRATTANMPAASTAMALFLGIEAQDVNKDIYMYYGRGVNRI